MRARCLALAVLLACAGCNKPADQALRDAAGSQPAQAARDSVLALAVKGRITAADVDSASSVNVSAQNGHVTISGRVRGSAQKAAMLQGAKEVPGVSGVSDELRIDPNAPRAGKDFANAALSARVSAALAAQTGVNALRVHVRAADGIVDLGGTAPTQAIKDTILATARKVPGVRRVIEHIRVEH